MIALPIRLTVAPTTPRGQERSPAPLPALLSALCVEKVFVLVSLSDSEEAASDGVLHSGDDGNEALPGES